jgi:hypothetical protein
MKVTLRQEGVIVCRLQVDEHGQLSIRVPKGMELRELELNQGDSRKLAGAILERSIKGTIGAVRTDLKRQMREQLERLFEDDDDDDDDDDEQGVRE